MRCSPRPTSRAEEAQRNAHFFLGNMDEEEDGDVVVALLCEDASKPNHEWDERAITVKGATPETIIAAMRQRRIR